MITAGNAHHQAMISSAYAQNSMPAELEQLSDRFRERGNSLYNRGEYMKAVQLYSKALTIRASVNMYNNRSLLNTAQ